jgi:hypothetical protein
MSVQTILKYVTLAVICLFLISCGIAGEKLGYPPDKFNVSKLRKSLIGSDRDAVIAEVGDPAYIFNADKAKYFIYQEMGTEVRMLTPYSREYPNYCFIMEFDKSDVLRKLDRTSCSIILKLITNDLRAEAENGNIDSAAVLAVSFGDFASIEKQSIMNPDAQRVLAMIKQGKSYDSKSMFGLNDSVLIDRASRGDPEASYQLYWNMLAPERIYGSVVLQIWDNMKHDIALVFYIGMVAKV